MSGVIDRDVLAGLISEALAQARSASQGLRETVIPAWPPARRSFPDHLARRLERGDVLDDRLVDDLATFRRTLSTRIEEGTQLGWQADVNHVRGGYEVVHRDGETAALASCAESLDVAEKTISSAMHALQGFRVAERMLDE